MEITRRVHTAEPNRTVPCARRRSVASLAAVTALRAVVRGRLHGVRFPTLILALALAMTVAAASPAAAIAANPSVPMVGAQDADDGPVQITDPDQQPQGGIIPRPNSGSAPDDPGDRGGAYQWILFGLIIVFIAVAFTSIRRTAKRTQAARAAAKVDTARP